MEPANTIQLSNVLLICYHISMKKSRTTLPLEEQDRALPAELSPTFINGVLRKEFGYDGVVITDGLYMQGITNKWTVPQAAVMALNAGDDMILGPNGSYQMMQVIDALKAALQNRTLAKSRVDEAATRIITLKLERHLILTEPPSYYGFNA